MKAATTNGDRMSEALPTVSMAAITRGEADADARVGGDLKRALNTWGACELVAHGVPADAVAGAFAAAARFFALPLETRMLIRVDRHNRGYVPMHQTIYPGNRPDLKESFNLGRPVTADDSDVLAGKPLHAVNRWPDIASFRDDVEAFFAALMGLGDRLLGPLAFCLGMPAAELRSRYRKPVAFMRLFHYPPNSNIADKEFGAAEHQDYGFLTILAQDANGGLEVRSPAGELVAVPPRPQSFIINAGDMLSEITAGAIRSAPHRVINRAGVARYSIPFFFDPDFDATFDGLPGVSAGEFLLGKFNKFYQHRKEAAAG
jgi:isopenicillin N synthase-like dioxygenase